MFKSGVCLPLEYCPSTLPHHHACPVPVHFMLTTTARLPPRVSVRPVGSVSPQLDKRSLGNEVRPPARRNVRLPSLKFGKRHLFYKLARFDAAALPEYSGHRLGQVFDCLRLNSASGVHCAKLPIEFRQRDIAFCCVSQWHALRTTCVSLAAIQYWDTCK
jgi:hypothetical protein